MAFEKLKDREKRTIYASLEFVSRSGFIDDFEFQTRIGISPEELNEIIKLSPMFDDTDPLIELAINNCLNEVCYGLEITETEWEKWFDVSHDEIKSIFSKWAKLKGWKNTGLK